jgi:hypothetical protein
MGNDAPRLAVEPDVRGFVRVVAPPDSTFRWLLLAIADIAASTSGSQSLLLLADLTAVRHPPGIVEQTLLGEDVARQLAHCKKVASLVRQGTKTGISEAVAQTFGLNLRVFDSEVDAVAWLLA